MNGYPGQGTATASTFNRYYENASASTTLNRTLTIDNQPWLDELGRQKPRRAKQYWKPSAERTFGKRR